MSLKPRRAELSMCNRSCQAGEVYGQDFLPPSCTLQTGDCCDQKKNEPRTLELILLSLCNRHGRKPAARTFSPAPSLACILTFHIGLDDLVPVCSRPSSLGGAEQPAASRYRADPCLWRCVSTKSV
jgi:hypothetical protein